MIEKELTYYIEELILILSFQEFYNYQKKLEEYKKAESFEDVKDDVNGQQYIIIKNKKDLRIHNSIKYPIPYYLIISITNILKKCKLNGKIEIKEGTKWNIDPVYKQSLLMLMFILQNSSYIKDTSLSDSFMWWMLFSITYEYGGNNIDGRLNNFGNLKKNITNMQKNKDNGFLFVYDDSKKNSIIERLKKEYANCNREKNFYILKENSDCKFLSRILDDCVINYIKNNDISDEYYFKAYLYNYVGDCSLFDKIQSRIKDNEDSIKELKNTNSLKKAKKNRYSELNKNVEYYKKKLEEPQQIGSEVEKIYNDIKEKMDYMCKEIEDIENKIKELKDKNQKYLKFGKGTKKIYQYILANLDSKDVKEEFNLGPVTYISEILGYSIKYWYKKKIDFFDKKYLPFWESNIGMPLNLNFKRIKKIYPPEFL